MKAFLTVIIVLLSFCGFSQERIIRGKVINSNDQTPVIGASIQILGAERGTTTNNIGEFSLAILTRDSILRVSYSGMHTQMVRVKNSSASILIKLTPEVTSLNEVVVIGYGTEQAKDITGAVGNVQAKDFTKGSVRDAAQLIAGKVAGLNVASPSGDPTAGTQIMLRGIPTLMSSRSPLVLIDGIPGDLQTVAPEDIASVSVLKDGSAAAIYGTRATNGVILITTREYKGGNKPPVLQYNGYVDVQTIAKRPDFLTGNDYRKLIGQGYPFVDYGTSTDWYKAISRTPVSHTHNFLLQGGSSTTNYTVNVNYRNWQGLLKRTNDEQLRGNITINHSMFNDKLKIRVNSIFTNRNYWTGGDGYSFNTYVYRSALLRNPTDSIKHADGTYVTRDGYFYDNPVALLFGVDGKNEERETRLNGSIDYNPIEGLRFKLLLSDNNWTQVRGFATKEFYPQNNENGWGNSYASRGTSATINKLLEFTTNYSKSFGENNVSALIGYDYQYDEGEGFWMQNWNFPTDYYSYNNMGTGQALGNGQANEGSNKSASKLIGFFGRVNYNFNQKYLLMASLRREGSSKFGSNNRWGMFPAISAGWRISQENFLKDNRVVTDLKLRAGYGVTGTAPSANYDALTTINYGARYLYEGNWIRGLSPTRNPNPDLRWEQKQETDIGLDFELFGGVIGGSIDVYNRRTKDMLYNYPVPVPPFLFSTITANVGTMSNKGIEVAVNFTPIKRKDFQWNSLMTFSTNKNKLVSINNSEFKLTQNYFNTGYTGEPIQTYTHRIQVGQPIGNFYGWKSVDIDSNGTWIVLNSNNKPVPIGNATEEDKRVLGNGFPKYNVSWNNNFQYKKFNLSINMHGAFGFQILDYMRMFYEDPRNNQYNMLKSAFNKVYGKTVLNNDLAYVSYYIENGDYWKIDNVTLGYTFDIKHEKYFKSVNVYVSTMNLLTITSYKGIDPEVGFTGGSADGGDPLSAGDDDRDKFPSTRTFTLGVNLNF